MTRSRKLLLDSKSLLFVSVYALTLQLSTPSQSMPYASAFFVLYIFI